MQTIKLHPKFETVLEKLPEQRLRQLMLWFSRTGDTIETRSQALQQIIDEVETLDFQSAHQLLQTLSLDEVVRFAILQEFGPRFAARRCYTPLVNLVQTHLRQDPDFLPPLSPQ